MYAIACVGQNWSIGYQGKLIYDIPRDKKVFKDMTMNSVVIMGRKTFDSLPGQKPLDGRFNIVLSKNSGFKLNYPNVRVVDSVDSAVGSAKILSANYPKGIFVMGGQSIYQGLIDRCKVTYITKVLNGDKPYDAVMPNLDLDSTWRLYEHSPVEEYKGLQFVFCIYIRAKQKGIIQAA